MHVTLLESIPSLIGLIGRKGAGKDTAAAVLLSNGYANVKFAGALKEMVRALLAYQGADAETIERMVEGCLKEEPTSLLNGLTPRFAMQTLGTEWGRRLIGSDFWVETAIRKAGVCPSVITDVRFPNEMHSVLAAGGVVIGITADWITAQEGEHESEALIDDLIAALPRDRRVTNHAGRKGQEREAIQQFQQQFLSTIIR